MKAYKFKLKTNPKFEREATRTLDACRELYNASVQERRDAWRINHISVNYQAQSRQLPDLKQERADFKEVYSQVLQDVLKRSDKAFDNFFRRVKEGAEEPGFPRFKGVDRYDSFTYPGTGFRLDGDKLHLSKIGSVRVRLSREIEGTVKTCTIKRECDGWYVIFTAAQTPAKPLPQTGQVTGLDLGVESFATFSSGAYIENPRFFKTAEPTIAEAHRKLAPKQKGSGRRKAAKKLVAKAHRKVQNQRQDFAHKLAHDLLSEFDAIALERLNVKDLKEGKYSKSVADVSWSTFTSILSHKAAEAGKTVIFVNPAYTSQDCSGCGHRQKIDVTVRWYNCPTCSLSLHRDHNAAINILVRAEPRLRQLNGIPHYSAALGA